VARHGPEYASSNVLEAYTYNATGDRLSKTRQGVTDTYGYTSPLTTHRLQAVDGQTRSYDANGNTLMGQDGDLSYDDRNRLAGWNLEDGQISLTSPSVLYGYNGRGERVSKQTTYDDPCSPPECYPNDGGPTGWLTGTQMFVYDEGGRLLGEYPNPNNIGYSLQYVYLDGVPVAYVANGQIYYIETDQLGTPRDVVLPESLVPGPKSLNNPTGAPDDDIIVWKWDYFGSTFGEDYPDEDPDGDGNSLTFNLRFPGQYYDEETGLNYNYFRDYEPGTGRYVESDPMGVRGGIDTYAYVRSNPLYSGDSFGLDSNMDQLAQLEKARDQAIRTMRNCGNCTDCGTNNYLK
jgi:RHS repeat-associated protein